MTDVDLVTKSKFSLYPFHSSDSILWWNYVKSFFSFSSSGTWEKVHLSNITLRLEGRGGVGWVGGADLLIESLTPGEERTSKFIDFRISRENTSAGCLNQEETSVLVKHRFTN